MEMNVYLCDDLHALCAKCHSNGCLKCFCNKDIRLDRNILPPISIKKSFQENLKVEKNVVDCLLDSLVINNMKKPGSESKNNILRNSRASLHSSKCLVNLNDADQVSLKD